MQEREVDIVTFFGDKKRDVGTQFSERHKVSFVYVKFSWHDNKDIKKGNNCP